MSYRIDNKKPKPKKNRSVAAMTSLSKVDIVNGQHAKMAYPLFYIETHLPKKLILNKGKPKWWKACIFWDRRVGWCMHPEYFGCVSKCHRCKHYFDMSRAIPLHIKEEYPNVVGEVHLEKKSDGTHVLDGITTKVVVEEPRDDYVVRVYFTANCQAAQTEMQQCKFSVVLKNNDENDKMSSVVVNGTLRVWPAIL